MDSNKWILALYVPVCFVTLLVVYVEAFVVLPEIRSLSNEIRGMRKTDAELESARQYAIDMQATLLRQQQKMLKQLEKYE